LKTTIKDCQKPTATKSTFPQWYRDKLILSFIFIQRFAFQERTHLRKGSTEEPRILTVATGIATLRLLVLLILASTTAVCQKTNTFKDKEREFEFIFPSNWDLDTLTSNPTVTAPEDSLSSRPASFQILSQKTRESINKCFQTYVLDYFPQQVDSFKILAQGKKKINGHKVKWIEFQYTKIYGSRTALIYLTVYKGRLYQMEGLAPSYNYPIYKSKFLEMIESIRLN
jgi:hypothetical protein